MQNKIDIALINKCIKKVSSAQRELYAILLPYLEAICRRYLVGEAEIKDVLQISFVHMFSNLSQFDMEKSSFKTWVTKITINNCLKNRQRHQKRVTEELIVDFHSPVVNPEIIDHIAYEDLLKWLKKMPSNYFEVFNLFVIDNFSHEEIAELLNIETALSRKRLSRARMWLKKKLLNENDSFSNQFFLN